MPESLDPEGRVISVEVDDYMKMVCLTCHTQLEYSDCTILMRLNPYAAWRGICLDCGIRLFAQAVVGSPNLGAIIVTT